MTPYHHDGWLTVYQGDCREVMRQMEPESVHCVVTSPPYWGLRDYGTASWVGGDEGCDHKPDKPGRDRKFTNGQGLANSTSNTSWAGRDESQPFGTVCGKCGATRVDSQLGLEATPEEFVANMVEVFREVKRVLRSDGTCWVNLGDSYAGGGGFSPDSPSNLAGAKQTTSKGSIKGSVPVTSGLKPKDLVGIPWRVAFALQADGWYLRSDIIWAKPNPMPESVTDRPTKSHEYLFLLTKSARYMYDADAVREASTSPQQEEHNQRYAKVYDAHTERVAVRLEGIQPGNVNNVGIHSRPGAGGRNLRTVWTIATAPYPGAHFATFPPKLVEPCIKAGAPEKVCGECGAGWRRVTDVQPMVIERSTRTHSKGQTRASGTMVEPRRSTLIGWEPSCAHGAETVPATVLDPFAGSGTVGMVAQSLSRRAVLIDLNGDYLVQAMSRNQQSPLGLETA